MPGIYTHNYIFRKSVEGVIKNKNRSYINRSIETLFSTPDHFKAGLFGSIGPNIFDYMHIMRKGDDYCNEITFALHDRNCAGFLQQLADIVLKNRDSRNEWASVQRGYLFGYISHIISDAVLHPYVFYSSGFPVKMERGEINYYRKMNLRFQYNIDNYFLYKNEAGPEIEILENMLPVSSIGGKSIIWPAIKYLLLESLKRENQPLLEKYFKELAGRKIDGGTGFVKDFDRIPSGIMLCYKTKRTENPKWIKIIDKMAENPLTYSDFFIRYPKPKRVDEDAMNFHQGRWQYPGLQRGFRYESVIHLIKAAIDQTVKVWELFEPAIYGNKPVNLNEIMLSSAYTGENGVFFRDMNVKDPVKIKV